MQDEPTLGIVTNVNDPAKGGAVKAAIGELGGDEYPEWIEYQAPAGVYFHPKTGDTVEVSVPEGEDITEFAEEVRYRGRVVLETEGYPDELKTNYPHRRGLKTPEGHLVVFDDKTGELFIQSKGGEKVTLTPAAMIELLAAAKIHAKAPLVDLTDTPTDYLIKGTTYNISVATLHGLWNSYLGGLRTALDVWKNLPPGPATTAHLIALATPMITLIDALVSGIGAYAGQVATFTSIKARTG